MSAYPARYSEYEGQRFSGFKFCGSAL